jgi:pyrroline-5-carboxylate reductase
MASQDMSDTLRIGFLGAGKMATALAQGWVRAGLVGTDNILAADPLADARDAFARATGAAAVASNRQVAAQSNLIILAVKPQQLGEVLVEIADELRPAKCLLISIVAGVTLAAIHERLGMSECRLIRVMPNTPCLVGASASAYAAGPAATAEDVSAVDRLFNAVGLAFPVPEKLLDAVTGLSASGPAFVSVVIEALSDGGVRMGLPRDLATQLAAQTVLGSAKLLLETGLHPGALKDMVASPAGTTIAGLHALERGGLRAALMDAVEAATLRSAELGKS